MLTSTRTFASKIRTRFFGNRVAINLEDADLALALQLGWVERFMWGYMLTDRGAEEMLNYYRHETNQT